MTVTLRGMVRLMRPKHWIKNLFVFVGVFFGHAWSDIALVAAAVLSFVSFSLMASAVYVLNDLVDVERDRAHPVKRNRPIASGAVKPLFAAALSMGLGLGGGIAGFAAGRGVIVMVVAYVFINIIYSLYLKHVVIADVFAISAGFMLRILAGTVGLGIEPSQWLLLTGLMLTLFLGFSKRRAELILVQADEDERKGSMRPVLDDYNPAMLDSFVVITAACTILSYGLYTVSPETVSLHGTKGLFYTSPFVVYGICRYIFLLHRGTGGNDTASDLMTDSHLILTVIGWILVTAVVLA